MSLNDKGKAIVRQDMAYILKRMQTANKNESQEWQGRLATLREYVTLVAGEVESDQMVTNAWKHALDRGVR